jgi:murein DD-endopeptidase MepM/ murein hydrolase activator NlpD
MTSGRAKKGSVRTSLKQTEGLTFRTPPFFYALFSKLLPFLVFYFLAIPVSGLDSPLPVIGRLDSRDTVFKQYLSDIEAGRRLIFSSRQRAAEELASAMTIYSYSPGENDNLLGIAARCNIPYATLASINRLSHLEDMASGKPMLLPTMPGIFIPETPATDLERLIFSARPESAVSLFIPRDGKTERFYFVPGDDFSPTERVFFLNRDFQFPLRQFQISSVYGMRINPVTGIRSMHGGIDLAAPEGTEVYAAKSGTVIETGEDQVLGKYVIIGHDNNMVSLYGHLSYISTSLNASVQSGAVIAKVGSTGQSTGPHLHFELRQNGQSRDPSRLLRLFQ